MCRVDLDNFEAEARSRAVDDIREDADENVVHIGADDMTVTSGRVMGATLVPKPAFQECAIQLEEGQEEETMVADGTYIGTPETESETQEMVRSALTAAGIPINPPRDWFDDPKLTTETPLTITDDGRVFGHIATWNTDHIGLPFSTRPPHSQVELRLLPHRPAAHRRGQGRAGRADHPRRWARLAGGRRRRCGQALRRHRQRHV